MRKRVVLSIILAIFLTLSGCSSKDSSQSEVTSGTSTTETVAVNAADMFTDRDMEIGYDEETSIPIILSGENATCDSDAVQISESTITIIEEGTYLLSGTLNDGMIIIDVEDTEKVQLVLDNAKITNTASAAIYVRQADKVFITTASGSENTLINAGEYIAIDDNNIDAVIFAKSDLTLNGAGTLTIDATAGHGIVSKDDLALTSGTYTITAQNQGLSGKDSVRIANGTYTIDSGKDGIHAENSDDTSLGFLYIADGSYQITSDGDGLSASAYLQIDSGTFTITTGEGSESVTMSSETTNFGKGPVLQQSTETSEEDSVSQKGIKADGTITILNGTITTDTVDDSIHAGGDILLTDGTYELKSGDDAIHSDAAVVIQKGTFTIPYCYEGIEGLSVTIDGGTFDIESEDDGLNAAGGADQSGFGGGGPIQDQFSGDSNSYITINGGNFTIVSKGDCMDSNGDLTINGGVLNLTCNGNGNTALDTDGTYSNNGGDVTTNDGSENNPGGMGGGMEKGKGRGGQP